MKKIISVLLSVLMVFSICPAVAFAGDTYKVTFTDLDYAKSFRTDAVGKEGYTLGVDYWFTYVDGNKNTVTVKDAGTSVDCEAGKPFTFSIVTADYIEPSTVRAMAFPADTVVSNLYNNSTGVPYAAYSIDENEQGTYAFYVNKDMNVTVSEYHLFNTGFQLTLPTSRYYNVVRLDKTDKGTIGPKTDGVTKRYTYLVTLEGFDITDDINNNVPITPTDVNDNVKRINAINEQAGYDAEDYFKTDKSELKTIRYDSNNFDSSYYFIEYTNSGNVNVTEKWHLKVTRVYETMDNCQYEALSGSTFSYIQSETPYTYYHTLNPGNDGYVCYTHQSLYFMVSLTVDGVEYARDEETGELTMNVAISQKNGNETVKTLLEPVWTAPDGLSMIYCIEDCSGSFSVSVNNAYGFSIDMIKEMISSLKAGEFDFSDLLSSNGSITGADADISGIQAWLLKIIKLISSLLKAFGLSVDLSGITEKIQNIGK